MITSDRSLIQVNTGKDADANRACLACTGPLKGKPPPGGMVARCPRSEGDSPTGKTCVPHRMIHARAATDSIRKLYILKILGHDPKPHSIRISRDGPWESAFYKNTPGGFWHRLKFDNLWGQWLKKIISQTSGFLRWVKFLPNCRGPPWGCQLLFFFVFAKKEH